MMQEYERIGQELQRQMQAQAPQPQPQAQRQPQQPSLPENVVTVDQFDQLFNQRLRTADQLGEQIEDSIEALGEQYGSSWLTQRIKLRDGSELSRERAVRRFCQQNGIVSAEAALMQLDMQGYRQRIRDLALNQARQEVQASAEGDMLPAGMPPIQTPPASNRVNQSMRGLGYRVGEDGPPPRYDGQGG
jgi:hypothetical protein